MEGNSMEILTNLSKIHETVDKFRCDGKIIGFVPTMGALHEGHLSLIRQSVKDCDVTIVSIYVNPQQFAPSEDLKDYPRPFEKDSELCEKEGVDLILHLFDEDIYPDGFCTFVNQELLTTSLCGASRPTFFRGVTTIVTKLFNLAKPHKTYFGQKDAQQAAVIKQMTKDLNFDIEVVVCSIVREVDGLALSSRNVYLSKEERGQAIKIRQGLLKALKAFESGMRNVSEIIQIVKNEIITSEIAKIDYIEVVNPENMQPIEEITGNALLATAVFFGNTRLIDNQIFPTI